MNTDRHRWEEIDARSAVKAQPASDIGNTFNLFLVVKIRVHLYYYLSKFSQAAQIIYAAAKAFSLFYLFNRFNSFNLGCGFAALGSSVVLFLSDFLP